MAATPEIPRGEAPPVQERQEEFIVPEVLQQSTGVKVVQKNFNSQVKGDDGKVLTQSPPTHVISVTPPASQATLMQQAKGSIDSSLTWLAVFWLRIIKKALHFGWQVKEENKNG